MSSELYYGEAEWKRQQEEDTNIEELTSAVRTKFDLPRIAVEGWLTQGAYDEHIKLMADVLRSAQTDVVHEHSLTNISEELCGAVTVKRAIQKFNRTCPPCGIYYLPLSLTEYIYRLDVGRSRMQAQLDALSAARAATGGTNG